MARSTHNIILRGSTGTIGKQLVIKRYGERTVISAYPDMSHVKKSTKQKTENQKFKKAAAYARFQMKDPKSKAAYQAKVTGMQRAYNLAIADYYNPPVIHDINISSFYGKAGDIIIVDARDDFKVIRVSLEIRDAEGTILEDGNLKQSSDYLWEYTITRSYPTLQGLQIKALAWDMPGNKTEKSASCPASLNQHQAI